MDFRFFKRQADVDTITKEISDHYAVVPKTLHQATRQNESAEE